MTKAKKFSLTELLNQRSMEQLEDASGEQTPQAEEIVMVDVHDLEPSRENFYQVDDSLKRSVELVGILQPLLVERPRNGKYRVIAGHRRRLAVLALVEEGKEERRYVPCVFKKEDVKDRLALIMANRFRDKTDWEKMMEAIEAEGLAKELKKDCRLGGRTREVLAELLGMSEAQLGRYRAIYNNLDRELMEEFKNGTIGFSAVSELCGMPGEYQERAKAQIREKGTLQLQDIREMKKERTAFRKGPGTVSMPERTGQREKNGQPDRSSQPGENVEDQPDSPEEPGNGQKDPGQKDREKSGSPDPAYGKRENGARSLGAMTAGELFSRICGRLKTKGRMPDILDYGLAARDTLPVTTAEFGLKSSLDYGGNEGIYLDLWVELPTDGGKETGRLGTFKTLHEGEEAMHTMAALLADFIIEKYAYVRENRDRFSPGAGHGMEKDAPAARPLHRQEEKGTR